MKKDYFAILGVKPTATDKEIRSAYKKLARKHHPDLNPDDKKAEERFKEVSEAYAVLSDPKKRRQWERGEVDFENMFRDAWGKGRAGGGFDSSVFGDIFSEIFGSMGRGGAAGGTWPPGQSAGGWARSRGADLQFETTIGFEEAIRGTTLRIPLARTDSCRTCGGDGRSGRSLCQSCGGTGTQRVNETIQVRIPPGADDGARVRVQGKGEAGQLGGPAGDLYVLLRVRPHGYFRRDGDDIVLDLPLTVTEAALGSRIEVPTISGRVTVTIPSGSRSGQKLRLRGKGAARRGGGGSGDQIVVLQIVTPPEVTERSRELFEELGRLDPHDPRANLGWT